MELTNILFRDVKTGKRARVALPITYEELKRKMELSDQDDLEYVIEDGDFGFYREHTSLEILNKFYDMVEDQDENLVRAVAEVTGYQADDFVSFGFSFEDCRLLVGVDTDKELGHYYVDEGETELDRETLKQYLDYEALGRDKRIESDGGFSSKGYVEIG